MAGQRIKVDQFSKTVAKILQQYSDDIYVGVDEIAEAIAKGSAKQIRSNAGIFNGTGAYKKGWTQKRECVHHYGFTWIVHNKTSYQLAHLLEYGHASVQGGRTPGFVEGREHIASVEEQATKEFENQVKNLIGG